MINSPSSPIRSPRDTFSDVFFRRGVCGILLGLLAWTQLAVAESRPNVLLIMADDYRAELASYGSQAITPNLDQLAQRSVQFQRAYCQQAVCNPSRSSMLTGRRPDTLHLWNNGTHFRELNPDVITMPGWFKDHGYTTRCVGKIFHNWHTKEKGDRRSWSSDEFLHYATHGDDLPQGAGPLPENTALAAPRLYGQVPLWECRDVPDEAYYDGRVAAEAVRVLQQVSNEPFFLAVGFWKPHAPMNAPKKYWDLYDRDKLPKLNPMRPVDAPEIAFHDGRELRGIPPDQVDFTPQQIEEIRHGYFANISYMDAQIGKVLQTLKASDVADQTIVVFVGDHGYHLGEQTLWAKTSNFELDARVPLLMHVPSGISAGARTDALAELTDLFPTLVELCHLPVPEGLDGKSLVPVLHDPQSTVHDVAMTQHPRPAYFDRQPSRAPEVMGYSIRDDRYRYTEWRDWASGETTAREIYDHQVDPNELRNLANQPDAAQIVERCAVRLAAQHPLVAPGWRQQSLPRSTPESQGIDSAQLLQFVDAMDQQVDTMHSVMVLRHGEVVAEGWWTPETAETPHVLWSLSKSFTSTAVGFAVEEGKLSLNDRVLDFFPDAAPTEPSANLQAMRVRDLLTMSTGHDVEMNWREQTEWVSKFLQHPVPHKPGTHFRYNTPATFMLSAIVQKVTGEKVVDYLQPRLFDPLGIDPPRWDDNPEGISIGGYGLYLKTEDIAKFGQLYLQNGFWNGVRVIPEKWIAQATSKQVSNGSNPESDWEQGYGFQFWRCRHGAFRGDGKDGQFCIVLPEQDAVVAITAHTGNMQNQLNLVWEHLLPAFKEDPLPENDAARNALNDRLQQLKVKHPTP